MSIAAAILLLAQLGTQPKCAFQEPSAPEASPDVQAIFEGGGASIRPVARLALREAISRGDAVGEAQANFSLARIAFEDTGKWPAKYVASAMAACGRGGCGPEMTGALFQWAYAVGPSNPSFHDALDAAFSMAEHETRRPRSMASQLLAAATRLNDDFKLTNAALRSRNLAQQVLGGESAAAARAKDLVREATAEDSLGELLVSEDNLERAGGAYSRATGIWSSVGCGLESVSSLMKWATILHSMKTKQAEMNEVLARALSATEAGNGRLGDAASALSSYSYLPVWKDASLTNRERYLELRQTRLRKKGEFEGWEVDRLAEDSESLGDLDRAFNLYSQLLNASKGDYLRQRYLGSLARIADKQGRKTEAAEYQRQAQKISEERYRGICGNGAGRSSGSKTSSAPAEAASPSYPSSPSRTASPWSPPTAEHPDRKSLTPGSTHEPPEHPGTEGGTPGEKENPH